MSPIASSLPQSAHSAAQNALTAAMNDPGSKPAAAASETGLKVDTNVDDGGETEEGEIDEGQELEAPVAGNVEGGDEVGSALAGLSLNDIPRTVFEDPMTFNHPLYTSWTLWFDSPQTKGKSATPITSTAANMTPATPMTAQAQNWMEDIKKVINFDSVEEFWGLYNNIVPPSQLPQKANYYLFKDNIIPAWEDEANKNGGKWSIQLPKDKNRLGIDKMWLYTMLAAIGETFDPIFSREAAADAALRNDPTNNELPKTAPPSSLITGVIVSTRPQFYRLSIWTRISPVIMGSGSPNPSTPVHVQSNGHGKALSSFGFSPALPPHPSEEGDALYQRVEAIGKHFKSNILGYPEAARLAGPLATEVEFISHKESERKKSGKKLVV
ncbi:eukaryotic translation initiation factor 4E [Tulasnella sp. 330]|nr:eukaryotic translation initiation factor 4E [Tulasnella sp. 330]KAG8878770.1 eukaryotic translation initiation factor 4E [Tulasnella sp. 331]KAG8884841.1 eukaryotic translation initiation factor 4E [Tulasnella sp. 332]